MTTALLAQASAILEEAGHAASPDSMRRVSATLESLAAWGSMDGVPRAGRLTADLDPPEFDTLAVLMGGKARGGEGAPLPCPETGRRSGGGAGSPARGTARCASRCGARGIGAREGHRARAAAVEQQKQEIEARYAEAKEAARLAAGEAKKTAQAVADAERSLAKAKGTRQK